MQPIAQSSLRSVDGSGLKKDEEALIKGLKPISGLVASYNKRVKKPLNRVRINRSND